MKNLIVLSLLSLSNICFGQIKMFEPNLISDNQVFGIAISPDGNEIFYVKAYGGRDSLHLYQSKKINGKWQNPTFAFFSDKKVNQIDPSFSPNGKTILFNAFVEDENRYDVYKIEQTPTGWGTPQKLSDAINTTAHEFYATMSNNKNIYFTRRMESNDIYVSRWKNGAYQKAVPISKNINTAESESNPYISPNEDFIIFISRRDDGFGNADLYVSFRKNDEWSYPLNLGKKINTKDSEFCPSIDLKNKRFFFSKTIVEESGNRIENIYSMPVRKLKLKKLQKQVKWNP